MITLIHMTATYSNAVLVAVLPYVSDFTKKLNLPVQQPITTNDVIWSFPSPDYTYPVNSVKLSNHSIFAVHPRGYVTGFLAATNWFYEQEMTDDRIPRYVGHDNMTTNEAIAMARDTLLKLGWNTNFTHSYEQPEVRGSFDLERLKVHIPYCQISWEWPKEDDNLVNHNVIHMEINMETKQLVGFTFIMSKTNTFSTVPVKVDAVPELESDYKKRMKASSKIFIDTNAPGRFPGKPAGTN